MASTIPKARAEPSPKASLGRAWAGEKNLYSGMFSDVALASLKMLTAKNAARRLTYMSLNGTNSALSGPISFSISVLSPFTMGA